MEFDVNNKDNKDGGELSMATGEVMDIDNKRDDNDESPVTNIEEEPILETADYSGSLSLSDITIETDTEYCSRSHCVDDEDTYKLACKACARFVHYRCTNLPIYQIQRFMTKGQQKFICVNCITVGAYIQEKMLGSNVQIVGKPDGEEISTLKEQIAKQQEQIKDLTRKLQDSNPVDMELNQHTKKRKRDIDEKESTEINILKKNVAEKESAMVALQKTNDELSLKQVEMDRQHKDRTKKLQEKEENTRNAPTVKATDSNILQTIEERFLKLESLITEKLSTDAPSTSFASIVSGIQSTSSSPTSNTTNFRTLMRTDRNEQITEDREKERRARNIIVHGCESSDRQATTGFIETLSRILV